MEKDLVTLSQIETNPNYNHIPFSRYMIRSLAKEGHIEVVKNKRGHRAVNIKQLEELIEREYPNELTSIWQMSNTPKYSYLNIGYNRLLSLGEQGFIKIKKNTQGKLAVNLKELEDFLIKEEAEQLVPVSQIVNNPQYSHYNLGLKRLETLYEEGHIEITINLHGYKSVVLRTLDEYIKKHNFPKDYITVEKIAVSPKYQNLNLGKKMIDNLVDEGHLEVFRNQKGYLSIEKDKLQEYLSLEKYILENYISYKEVLIRFGYSSNSTEYRSIKRCIAKLKEYGLVETIIFKREEYCKQDHIDWFLSQFVLTKTAAEILGVTNNTLWKIIRDKNVEFVDLGPKKYVNREQLITARKPVTVVKAKHNASSKKVSLEGFYNTKEVMEILGCSKRLWGNIRKEEAVTTIRQGGINYYSKKDIEKLKHLQQKYQDNYYNQTEIQKKFQLEYYRIIQIKRIPTPALARPLFKRSEFLYSQKDVHEKIKQINTEKQFYTIEHSSPVDTFNYKINILNISFSQNSIHTKKYWLQYIYGVLNSRRCSEASMQKIIHTLVKCTGHMAELTKNKEIYSVTSNDINLLFNRIPLTDQKYLYFFLKELNERFKAENIRSFKFSRIINPFEVKPDTLYEKTVYTFKEYKELYGFVNDVQYHKSLAIKDVRKYIKGENSIYYASSWLYVLIHLNNAWRHGDVIEFPRIDLTDTSIKSLEWLEENDLTFEDAKKVINQVIRTDLKISKTQASNHFFCSDDLTIAVATASVICEFRARSTGLDNTKLIYLGNKNNQFYPRTTAYKAFFNDFKQSFKFESRKMNRSIITYLYILLSKHRKGGAALELAQRLRGHKDFETTNLYIQIPQEELDFITHQLFSRGYFGYIPNLFADILFEEEISRDFRTDQITSIKERFGSIYKIEATSGFLNAIQSERQSIVDIIRSMSIQEASEYMHKIFTEQLPSKEENFQCLVSEQGCIMKGKGISCMNCPLSIPNFYALSTVTNSIQTRMKEFQKSVRENTLQAERTRKANLLYMELNLLAEAIETFGHDEVYKFFDGERGQFIELMNQIESLQEVVTIS
ncbi:hypothetical protein ACFQ3N_00590 [Virgibacillus byunsanensis]|uniref:Helix-turn-helix domain-containing protein n=1 Tax=Virgibacillus byunsanensis TaxID=570945 RepID=A0ABW3LI34_9BACI